MFDNSRRFTKTCNLTFSLFHLPPLLSTVFLDSLFLFRMGEQLISNLGRQRESHWADYCKTLVVNKKKHCMLYW